MEFKLSKEHRALQEKAREFTEQVLFPYEMECEENNGITPETHKKITEEVMKWGFNATNHSKEHGGQGMTLFEQMLVSEQLACPPALSGTPFPSPPFP